MSCKRKTNTDPPDKAKRQRPDVRERKERNKTTEVSVVKCSLNSFCNESARALPWESVLKDMNKAVKEAFILANVRVLNLCQHNRPIPPLDQVFYYNCLSAVSVGLRARRKIDDSDLRQSVELYKSWRVSTVKYASSACISSGWFQNESLQMATNASNHIVVNFYRRFQKYVKQRFGITGKDRYQLLRDVLAPNYEGNDKLVTELRGWIPRNKDGYIDKDNPHLILPVMYSFLQFIEAENDSHHDDPEFQQLRTFSLLPLKRGFESSHFKVCKLGLHALLQRAGIPIPPLQAKEGLVWNDVVDEWWYKLFNIAKFETENRKFAGEILTDGKAVSIVLRKSKRPVQEKQTKKDSKTYNFGEVWGLDPGRRDLFVATNNFGQTISCSSREFYGDAKYKSSNITTHYWIEHDPKILEAIRNMPSPKTCSLQTLEAYVRFLIPRLDQLLDFRMVKPFRKLKFRRYIFMKKKLRELCQKLTARAGRNTLVGFGDWGATDYGGLIKKCPGGPVKKLEKELKHFCTVDSIPEFRTSKLHADCHRELTYQFALRKCKDEVVRRVKIYSALVEDAVDVEEAVVVAVEEVAADTVSLKVLRLLSLVG
ncbi:Hypothetical protein PHPALM_6351 [Phytophthora palmivora]|uniref:Uncharacterized protein n=1 Tax=Phytophthora palmivora TaxID=4796 RepID=A0A2P4YFE2_9STRA|nr:Hypothetical protein PHPALM_6351 [Phytophthora palmivora]